MDGSGDMTLAFELAALQQTADPEAVFTDARGWTRYIGVVSEKPTYVVTNYTRKHRIRQDFFSGPRGVRESLESVKRQFETDRHVFIGTSADDESIADDVEWEFLAIENAAEAAGWELADGDSSTVRTETGSDDWP